MKKTIENTTKIIKNKNIYAKFIAVIKDVSNLEDTKSYIVNSGLIWDKLILDTVVLKVVYIKVLIDNKDFWLKRLQQSNVFSFVAINSKDALGNIKYITENTIVKLRKTHCHGLCAVYDVIFLKDGKVIFNGIENVLVKGNKEFKITKRQIEKLNCLFKKTSFKNYSNAFKSRSIVDLPSTFITYKNKQIEIKLWKKCSR
ncbi:DUF6438 domain-containing protein [Polaribacter ponticola]|uniref:DUF6438 domain-containing protein n=1 Tax=Polaribacter ponticola TaxID=2978475 RepID=A0ABT5S9R2_9FLAO|nr:DUF6438 domain-containing protein [Polaribacter sp. MSW5]MDD7914221.1 DUF6438 domain-containing protein [Polaribacter sp. MSW5]